MSCRPPTRPSLPRQAPPQVDGAQKTAPTCALHHTATRSHEATFRTLMVLGRYWRSQSGYPPCRTCLVDPMAYANRMGNYQFGDTTRFTMKSATRRLWHAIEGLMLHAANVPGASRRDSYTSIFSLTENERPQC